MQILSNIVDLQKSWERKKWVLYYLHLFTRKNRRQNSREWSSRSFNAWGSERGVAPVIGSDRIGHLIVAVRLRIATSLKRSPIVSEFLPHPASVERSGNHEVDARQQTGGNEARTAAVARLDASGVSWTNAENEFFDSLSPAEMKSSWIYPGATHGRWFRWLFFCQFGCSVAVVLIFPVHSTSNAACGFFCSRYTSYWSFFFSRFFLNGSFSTLSTYVNRKDLFWAFIQIVQRFNRPEAPGLAEVWVLLTMRSLYLFFVQ